MSLSSVGTRHHGEDAVEKIQSLEKELLMTKQHGDKNQGLMEHQTECLQLKLKERENAIEQLTEQCSQLVIARDVMVLKQQEIDQTPHGGHEKTNLEVLDHVRKMIVKLRTRLDEIHHAMKHVDTKMDSSIKCSDNSHALLMKVLQSKKEEELRSSEHRHQESMENQVQFQKLYTEIRQLEDENAELKQQTVEKQNKITEIEASLLTHVGKVEDLQNNFDKANGMLMKQRSATLEGTRAIEELQQSVIKLTEKLKSEQELYRTKVSELVSRAKQKEQDLTSRLEAAESKGVAMTVENQNLIDRIVDMNNSMGHHHHHRAPPPPPKAEKAMVESSSRNQLVFNQSQTSDDVPDPIEGPKEQRPSAVIRPPKRLRVDTKTDEVSVTSEPHLTSCGTCHEDAFGYMLKCSTCQQQYHAGCVSGKKKRRSFICPSCSS